MPEDYDLIIVGAGTAGVIAALTAAHQGARVALVEATGRVGGTAIHGLHQAVCGLFHTDGNTPGDPLPGLETLAFCARLIHADPARAAVRRGRVWILPFAGGTAWEACASEHLAAEPNIRLFLNARPTRADRRNNRLDRILLASGSELSVRAAIDCTGAATLCRLCGATVSQPAAPALAGFGFSLQGVDPQARQTPLGLAIEVPLLLRREADAGRLARHFAFTTWEPGDTPETGWVKLAVPSELGTAGAHHDALSVLARLRHHPAFRDAHVTRVLAEPIPRETCHLNGEYVLSAQDVLSARSFPDGIVRAAWPIERWAPGKGVVYRYLPPRQHYEIPLRSLRPETGPGNLLCASAAFSAMPDAAASARVMGTCMALGEAAALRSLSFL